MSFPLGYCEPQHVCCIAIPFAVLLVVGLLESDFALFDKTVEPFLSPDYLHSLSLAEHDAVAVEATAYDVQLQFSVRHFGVVLHSLIFA